MTFSSNMHDKMKKHKFLFFTLSFSSAQCHTHKLKKLICAAILFFAIQTSFAQKWLWANAGTNSDTVARCVPWANATDTAGNIFVAGGYTGIITFGSYTINSTFGKPFAATMLIKYNAAGNVLWAKTSVTRPPYSWCFAYSVATDKAGNAYATGMFFDSISFGAYTISSASPNIFLVKYDPNGNVLWIRTSALHSSQCSAQGNFVAVDPSGNPYVTGVFNDTVSFGTTTLTNGSTKGNAFIVKYDPNGNPLWAESPTSLSCEALGTGLATDNAGNIYETGNYNTATTISFGAFNLGNGLSRNMFLTKYDGNGNVLWATNASIPSSASAISISPQLGEAVTTDAVGNVYVSGNYTDTVTFGTQTLTDGLNIIFGNIFVAKYSAAGKSVWARSGTIPNNNNFATDYSITADKWSNIYLSGVFYGSLSLGGISYTSPVKCEPTFITKMDSAGNVLCGTSINNEYAPNGSIFLQVSGHNSVAADPKGPNVYLTGDIQGYNQCIFGTDTVNGLGEVIGFAAKWTCGTCNIAPNLVGLTSVCSGQTITLVAGGGLNYVWSTGATGDSLTFSPSSSKYYYVAITNDSCTRNDSINIAVHPVPIPTISNAQTICEGSTAHLSASGGSAYSWQPIIGLSSATVANTNASPATTTNYTVTISNGFCNATDSTTIYVNPYPPIVACCDTSIAPGQSVQLNSSGGGTYLWETSSGLSCTNCTNPVASPLVSTTYTLTITSDSGCTVSRTITIDVNCGEVFIPEAFSPNGDGKNDVLYVRGDCIKTLNFIIFDRWGNRIFETTDKYIGWNGEYKGQAMNTGSYVYYISATNYDGTSFTRKGNVELVR